MACSLKVSTKRKNASSLIRRRIELEFLLLVTVLIVVLIGYFFIGMLIKFLWGWFPLIIAIFLGITIGLYGGWANAVFGFIFIIGAIIGTNAWHGSSLYLRCEEAIEKLFYFHD